VLSKTFKVVEFSFYMFKFHAISPYVEQLAAVNLSLFKNLFISNS